MNAIMPVVIVVQAIIALVLVGIVITSLFYRDSGRIKTAKAVASYGLAFAATFVVLEAIVEAWHAYSSESPYESFLFHDRAFGTYGWTFWIPLVASGIVPLVLFIPLANRYSIVCVLVSMIAFGGDYLALLLLKVENMSREFLPESWDSFNLLPF